MTQFPTYIELSKLLGLQPQQLALLDRVTGIETPGDMHTTLTVMQCLNARLFHRFINEPPWIMPESTALHYLQTVVEGIKTFSETFQKRLLGDSGKRLPIGHISVHDGSFLFMDMTSLGEFTWRSDFYHVRTGQMHKELPHHPETITMLDLSVMLLRMFDKIEAVRKQESRHDTDRTNQNAAIATRINAAVAAADPHQS